MGKHRVAPVCPQPPPHPFKVKPLGGGGLRGDPHSSPCSAGGLGTGLKNGPPTQTRGGRGKDCTVVRGWEGSQGMWGSSEGGPAKDGAHKSRGGVPGYCVGGGGNRNLY